MKVKKTETVYIDKQLCLAENNTVLIYLLIKKPEKTGKKCQILVLQDVIKFNLLYIINKCYE